MSQHEVSAPRVQVPTNTPLVFVDWVKTFECKIPIPHVPSTMRMEINGEVTHVAVEPSLARDHMIESYLKLNNLKLLTIQDVITCVRSVQKYTISMEERVFKRAEDFIGRIRCLQSEILSKQDSRDVDYISYMKKLREDIDRQGEYINEQKLEINRLISRVAVLESEKIETKGTLDRTSQKSNEDQKTIASLTLSLEEEKKTTAALRSAIDTTSKIYEESKRINYISPSDAGESHMSTALSVSDSSPLIPPQISFNPLLSVRPSTETEISRIPSPIETNLIDKMLIDIPWAYPKQIISTPSTTRSESSLSTRSSIEESKRLKPLGLPTPVKIESIEDIGKAFSYALFGDYRSLQGNIWTLGMTPDDMRTLYERRDPRTLAFYNASYSILIMDKVTEKNAKRYVPWGYLEIVTIDRIEAILKRFAFHSGVRCNASGMNITFY